MTIPSSRPCACPDCCPRNRITRDILEFLEVREAALFREYLETDIPDGVLGNAAYLRWSRAAADYEKALALFLDGCDCK